MSQADSIRRLGRRGESVTDIAREVGVSRDTVHAWLTEDLGEWKKRRHTAHGVWVRLTEELGADAECVCQALMDIFLIPGGVPSRIVFDNATGVGRRVCGTVRLTEPFSALAAHFGFDYRFCNPHSGNEKGAVENKVGAQRRNLFVPVPKVWDVDGYNGRLAERCLRMAEKEHYRAGEREIDLFEEDREALRGLPAKPFSCVTYARPKADKKGRVRLDGKHWYSTLPAYAGRTMIAAMGATRVEVYDVEGTLVCSHRREYGKAPTDTSDPGSQLALPCNRIGGWENSRVRFALHDGLRDISRAGLVIIDEFGYVPITVEGRAPCSRSCPTATRGAA